MWNPNVTFGHINTSIVLVLDYISSHVFSLQVTILFLNGKHFGKMSRSCILVGQSTLSCTRCVYEILEEANAKVRQKTQFHL